MIEPGWGDAAIQDEHEALLQFLYLAPVGLIQADRRGEIALINPVSVQLLMPLVDKGALSNVFDALADVAPDLRHRVSAFHGASGVVCETMRVSLVRPSAAPRQTSVLSVTVVLLDEQRMMVVLQDVTESVRRERALREQEAWFNAILTGIRDYALVPLDAEGRIERWNESIGRVTGHTEADVVGQPYTMLQEADALTAHGLRDRLHEADTNGWSVEEGWRLRADGSRFWASALLAPLGDRFRADGGTPRKAAADAMDAAHSYSLILRDISDKREASEALRRATRCDQLTGLLNRHAFFEAVDIELARCRREPRALSLVVLDVDHFKSVNDRHGHPTGDLVLQRIADVLASSFRAVDTVARVGGEEFVVLMPAAAAADARRVADRCRAAVAAMAVDGPDGPVPVTLSGGVAELDPDNDDFDALMQRADRALYRAKVGGRNRIEAAAEA